MAENQESPAAPERVYTVGDTIRLSISFLSEANVEEVQAFFEKEEIIELSDEDPTHVLITAGISFEGTVEETEVIERMPYELPLKRHTAILVSLVDRDHDTGYYKLATLGLRTSQGQDFQWVPEESAALAFEVAAEPRRIEGVDISLTDEPEHE